MAIFVSIIIAIALYIAVFYIIFHVDKFVTKYFTKYIFDPDNDIIHHIKKAETSSREQTVEKVESRLNYIASDGAKLYRLLAVKGYWQDFQTKGEAFRLKMIDYYQRRKREIFNSLK